MKLIAAYVDQRNEIHDYEELVSALVWLGNIQDSDCKLDAVGIVQLEVGRVACCHMVIRAPHSPRDLGKAYLHVDDYKQVAVLGRRLGRAGDRMPDFDNTDIQLACNLSAREAG